MRKQEQMTPEQRIAQLEAQIAVLIAEIEKLKGQFEPIQIGYMTLISDDARFLSALETVNKNSAIKLLGNEQTLNCSFLWSIAMARKSNDSKKEEEALNDYAFLIDHADMVEFKFDTENAKMLISEIQNKSWNEIVQMIRQMINGTTLRNENQGPQR